MDIATTVFLVAIALLVAPIAAVLVMSCLLLFVGTLLTAIAFVFVWVVEKLNM